MKFVLICLLFIFKMLNAQIDDKFIILDSDSNSSFNSAFNQKYQLFPQFTNLYQGFLVKPAERQGYYAWIQLKQDGYLKDTIIWIDNTVAQSIFSKFPTASSLQPDPQPTDYVLTGRARMLSFMNHRKEIKRNNDVSVVGNLNDSINIYNNDFAWDYSKFSENILDESWEVSTDSSSYKDVALKGKFRNKLVITRNNDSRILDINKITSLKYSGTSMWLLGTILGIPTGALIGGIAGALIETKIMGSHGDFAGIIGFFIGGLVGAVAGGVTGGILFDKINTGTEINLTTSDPYDKYFELDTKTFFAIPELIADTSIMVNNGKDTNSTKLAKSEEQYLVADEIRRQSELEKPQFSIGGGFFYPLNFNLNMLFYFNDYFGFSYTGFPVPFKENDNEDCSRYGIFYRIHAKKNFFDNVGIHYSQRSQSTYDYHTYERIRYKFSEIGMNYDLSFYGVFFQVGFNYVTTELYSYHIDQVSFHFQFGYRYTF